MILINQVKLDVAAALSDDKHPLHENAVFYDKSIRYLRETYGKYMNFKDPKQPRYCKGSDSRGVDIPKMKEPDIVMRIPLSCYYVDKKRGKEQWACCLSNPVPQPGGLWDMGATKALTIKGNKVVDLDTDAELAFFLSYISPFVRKKLLKIDDPVADAKKEGDRIRAQVARQTAIWNMLDDDKLIVMAQGFGIANAGSKPADTVRIELQKILEKNDQLKKSNPAIRGTVEFLEEMKVPDGLILRSFVQKAIDEKKVTWKADGRWRVGEKIIFQVAQSDLERKFDALCNYLSSTNNKDKLLDFVGDLVTKDYLLSLKDSRVYEWLARVAGLKTAFVAKTKFRAMVIEHFCGETVPETEQE